MDDGAMSLRTPTLLSEDAGRIDLIAWRGAGIGQSRFVISGSYTSVEVTSGA